MQPPRRADKKDTAERIIGFPGQSKRSLSLTRPSDEPDSATVSPIVQRSFSHGDPCRRLLVVRSRLRFRDIGRLEIGSRPPFIGLMVGASDCSVLSNVRFGSLADISQCNRHVRFTPESGTFGSTRRSSALGHVWTDRPYLHYVVVSSPIP